MHQKRLHAIISLSAVDAQVAKLLLIHCALPRLVFLTQTTPLDAAAEAFERGHASILDAWMKIVDLSDADMNVKFVRDRVTMPLGFGGQGITNICEIAENALTANWQYTSSYLASRVPALAGIAAPSEDGTLPMNGMIEPVWDRVRARGAEGDSRRERNILPEFADSAAAPCTAKGLQHLLTQMFYARKFERVRASAVELIDDHHADPHAREFAAQVAVTMDSLRGEGATAWHTVIPFSKAVELSTAHVRNQVRLELGLIPAAIKILVDRKIACHHAECGNETFTHNAAHHILDHKEGNAGGNRVRTHDRVVRAVAQLCKDVGLGVETKGIRGLLPPDAVRGGRHECAKTVDISITGLDSEATRTLGDVVVPHPFKGDGIAKYNGQRPTATRSPANIQLGEYTLEAEKKKLDWYGNIPAGRRFGLVPMAIDTYGFKAPLFRKFLNDLADHGARGTVPAGDAASEAATEATLSAIARSKSYWKRRIMGHISVALVSAIGNRIAGAPSSYALRTARDSENFHAGAAAQILFMEPDTAGDFHIAPAPCAREAHMGFMNPVVGLLTT